MATNIASQIDESTATNFAALFPQETIHGKVEAAVNKDGVVVFGRSTCPFCIEITRTLADMGIKFTYYKIDQMTGAVTGPEVHEALKASTGQRTVPYVYINGRLVGGCDATKAVIATGEFEKLLGAGKFQTDSVIDLEIGRGDGAGKDTTTSIHPKLVGVDDAAPKVIGTILEFPNTVDNRIIRLVAVQVFVLAVLIAALAYKEDDSWKWVSVGLLVDFCLRFYGGAGISPLGSIAMFASALYDLLAPKLFKRETGPIWGAGPPKQFAVAVGVFFSTAIVVLQFTDVWQAVVVFAGILAFFAGLEAFLNFCAGCWVFGKAIKFGIIPDTAYIIHINTLPETKYQWEDWTKQVNPPAPKHYTETFKDHGTKSTRIDLQYKTGKGSDWEREAFDYVKYSKMMFFSSIIGVAAIPAMFKFMSLSGRFNTPPLIWQILTLLSLIWTAFFTIPYILKMIKYPKKIAQEWMHPAMNNAMSVPSMTLIVYAFLAWDTYSTTLAKVLWWAGMSTSMLLAIIIIGNWMSTMRHDGHVNGAWMMPPVGLYIAAVVGPTIDPSYKEISFLPFGLASIMYITLFVMLFQRFAVGHNADPRGRMFAAIWFAAPAVASIAWTILNVPSPPPDMVAGSVTLEQMFAGIKMDAIGQTLFYVSVSMALVCVWAAWRRFLWTDKFFMQMWAWGFPSSGLAWAAILYDNTVQTELTKIFAVFTIVVASIAAFVLVFRTMGGVARLKVFVPEHKWGPMSHLPLAQDAMRALLEKIVSATDALAEQPGNARLAASLRNHWRTYTTINTFYSTIKRDICFPQIGQYFPGHQDQALANNQHMLDEQAKVDAIIQGGPTKADLAALKVAVHQYDELARATYDHVEDHVRPVVRRYISGPSQKKIMIDCWDDAPPEGWFQVIGAVVQNLPMQSQRLTYIRAFLWAMPERCQQIGTMVALGTDPVTWYRIKHALPDIIPRGEAGWKKF